MESIDMDSVDMDSVDMDSIYMDSMAVDVANLLAYIEMHRNPCYSRLKGMSKKIRREMQKRNEIRRELLLRPDSKDLENVKKETRKVRQTMTYANTWDDIVEGNKTLKSKTEELGMKKNVLISEMKNSNATEILFLKKEKMCVQTCNTETKLQTCQNQVKELTLKHEQAMQDKDMQIRKCRGLVQKHMQVNNEKEEIISTNNAEIVPLNQCVKDLKTRNMQHMLDKKKVELSDEIKGVLKTLFDIDMQLDAVSSPKKTYHEAQPMHVEKCFTKDKDIGKTSCLKEVALSIKNKIKLLQRNIDNEDKEVTKQENDHEKNLAHFNKKEAEYCQNICKLKAELQEKDTNLSQLKDRLLYVDAKHTLNEQESLNSEKMLTESEAKLYHIEYEQSQMKINNEYLKNEIGSREDKLREHEVERVQMLRELKESNEQVIVMQTKSAELQRDSLKYDQIKNDLQKQLENMNKKYVAVNERLVKLLMEKDKIVSELNQTIIELKRKISDLTDTEKSLNLAVRDKDNRIYMLYDDLERYYKMVKKGEKELEREMENELQKVKPSQKGDESKHIIHSFEQQLNDTEAIMRQPQLDITQEKQLISTKDKDMVKMTEEIKSLKLQVKQKESTLQKYSEQYKDAVKLKQEAESKLNEIIHIHETEIRHLQEVIERKDNEIARIEQITICYVKVQSTLNESQEKEVTLRETIKELKNKNLENENRISELKRKLDKTSEESHKMEYELKETIHLLNQKIKSIETEKDQYKQDIANTKQLSKAAQIKMSEMGTGINDLTNKLKTKEDELQKGEERLSGIVDSQKEQILEREVQKQERKLKSVEIGTNNKLEQMTNNFDKLENQLKHMLSKLHDTDADLDETKSRPSRVMEDTLTDNNLNIIDLSDRNRPTKIAEKCDELYENEWTYAFEVLEKLFRTEQGAIEALLLILQNTMHFCKTMARRQIEIIEREMYFADENERIAVSSSSSYIQKIIKDRRKATATDAVRNLKKIYVAQLKKSKDEIMRAALDVEPYTSECIEICWLMLIQDPPVVFAPLPIKDSSFNSEFYKPYTKSGSHVDFAVWPALLLHDGGPILAKGVAQGYENY